MTPLGGAEQVPVNSYAEAFQLTDSFLGWDCYPRQIRSDSGTTISFVRQPRHAVQHPSPTSPNMASKFPTINMSGAPGYRNSGGRPLSNCWGRTAVQSVGMSLHLCERSRGRDVGSSTP